MAQGDAHFDTILIDVQMPGEDGSSLARALREKAPEAKVLLMSGRFPSSEQGGTEQPFILKPFSLAKLVEALSEAT